MHTQQSQSRRPLAKGTKEDGNRSHTEHRKRKRGVVNTVHSSAGPCEKFGLTALPDSKTLVLGLLICLFLFVFFGD